MSQTPHQKRAMHALQILAAISLLALPILQGVAFLLHYESHWDFLNFSLAMPPYSVDAEWAKIIDPEKGWRFFFLPHYLAYFILPLYLVVAGTVARTIWAKAPMFAVIGAAITATGIVFMGGVFGAWLAFGAVTDLGTEAGLAAFKSLTEMRGALMVTSLLSLLSVGGMVILGVGMIVSRAVPLWAGIAFTLGNLMIVVMMDRDNWMFIGAMLMLVGVLPILRHLMHTHLAPHSHDT